ncbi:MAG TPA: CPBP family intramembrane glutamic endopeptidase [Myxococcota bacterium]
MLWLLLVSAMALVIFRAVDTTLFHALPAPLAVLADVRVTSLLVLVALCVAAPSARALLAWPHRSPSRRVVVLCVVVVAIACVAPALTGVGIVALPRWQDRLAFHVVGVVNEELLCRALVLGAALAVWPRSSGSTSTLREPAVIATTIVFSLLHAQYHGFVAGPALYAQLLWTLPTGLALTALAFETRSVWPAVGVHVVNNALVGVAELVRSA